MLEIELSLRLAIAIGWPYDGVHIRKNKVYVPWGTKSRPTRAFDYKDPEVIWEIAERYDTFPMRTVPPDIYKGKWCALMSEHKHLIRYADTAKKAVALSVIAYDEHMKRVNRHKSR